MLLWGFQPFLAIQHSITPPEKSGHRLWHETVSYRCLYLWHETVSYRCLYLWHETVSYRCLYLWHETVSYRCLYLWHETVSYRCLYLWHETVSYRCLYLWHKVSRYNSMQGEDNSQHPLTCLALLSSNFLSHLGPSFYVTFSIYLQFLSICS